ncbi:MAG: hypothetical protein ACRCX4_00010 [Bacteroidales bacterium]
MKDIWMYLLPSGFIASLLTWLVNRRRERLKDIKEEHSVYRELYEDLRVLIKKQNADYAKLRNKVFRLEKAFEEINRCPYRRHCPLLHGLPVDEKDGNVGADDTDRKAAARGDPAA